MVHGEPEGQEILKEKIVETTGLPVTIPSYGQTYTLEEELTMEQTVKPLSTGITERRDILEKMRVLREQLEDMESIVKEEYLTQEVSDTSISLLKLRLNEIEEQIIKIVEKN